MKKILLPVLAAVLAASVSAEVRLANVFGEHMVLQRQRAIELWGWATPGQTLAVELAGHKATAKVAADGQWRAKLPALPAGGPHKLRVKGDQLVELNDVLIGDVWLLGGQSNMEWPLKSTDTGAAEIASPQNGQLRHIRVPMRASVQPADDIAPAPWVVAEPGAVGDFSAVGYHFAKQMQAVQGVPIGLLDVSWGGSNLETWVRRSVALADPELAPAVRALPPSQSAHVKQRGENFDAMVKAWSGGDVRDWSQAADVDAGWQTLQAPKVWEQQGMAMLDGVVWMRRTVELTAAQAAGEAELGLGKIDDCDEAWVNGQRVGGQCGYHQLRRYKLAPGVLKAGRNWIAVRITDTGGQGGFHGDAALLRLDTAAGSLPLAGAWRARIETSSMSQGDSPNDAPTLAHNGLIAPLRGLPVRGVLWYQGESNVGRAAAYAPAFKQLIQDWRVQRHSPDLPFLFVQLAAFMPVAENVPGEGEWAELREAQAAALALPHTGMAVAIDLGDPDDIHPRNKRSVGQRLAALALKELGLRSASASGPRHAGSEIRGREVWLRFSDTAGGLRPSKTGEPLRGFVVAGADKRFVPAAARIESDWVVVSSPAVPRPLAARYAWVNSPGEANLVGGDGLPVPPLRSDAWDLRGGQRQAP